MNDNTATSVLPVANIRRCRVRCPVPVVSSQNLSKTFGHLALVDPNINFTLMEGIARARLELFQSLNATNSNIGSCTTEQLVGTRDVCVRTLSRWYEFYSALLKLRHVATVRLASGDQLPTFEWTSSDDVSRLNGPPAQPVVISCTVLRFETVMLLWATALSYYNVGISRLESPVPLDDSAAADTKSEIRSDMAMAYVLMRQVILELNLWNAMSYSRTTRHPGELDLDVAAAFSGIFATMLHYSITVFTARNLLYKERLPIAHAEKRTTARFANLLVQATRLAGQTANDTAVRCMYQRCSSPLIGMVFYMRYLTYARIYASVATEVVLTYEKDLGMAYVATNLGNMFLQLARFQLPPHDLVGPPTAATYFDDGSALARHLAMVEKEIPGIANAMYKPLDMVLGSVGQPPDPRTSFMWAMKNAAELNMRYDVMAPASDKLGHVDISQAVENFHVIRRKCAT